MWGGMDADDIRREVNNWENNRWRRDIKQRWRFIGVRETWGMRV